MHHCFINGVVKKVSESFIGVNDIGLLRSYAVFDYFRTYNGKPFRIADHLIRFRNSARSLNLELKYSNDEVRSFILDLIEKSGINEVGVRLILTGGYASDGVSISEPNFIIITEDLPKYNDDIYKNGVKLISFEYQREVATSKTTDYMNAIRLAPNVTEAGAFDILYYFDRHVLELSRNNIFLVKDSKLITPSDKILKGITRSFVLNLANDLGIKAVERTIQLDELASADEVFITGTTKRIVPVYQIDQIKYQNIPGEITQKLSAEFNRRVEDF